MAGVGSHLLTTEELDASPDLTPMHFRKSPLSGSQVCCSVSVVSYSSRPHGLHAAPRTGFPVLHHLLEFVQTCVN